MEMVKRERVEKGGAPETRAQAHVEQVVKRRKHNPSGVPKFQAREAIDEHENVPYGTKRFFL